MTRRGGGWLKAVRTRLGGRPKPATPDARPLHEVRRAEGDAAREAGHWAAAAMAYGEVFALQPHNAGIAVQWGHALKECGRRDEAEAAYRQAVAVGGPDPDAPFQLGALLFRAGRKTEAHDAFAEALTRDPEFGLARQMLIADGRRDLLPETARGQAPAARFIRRIETLERDLSDARSALSQVSIFASHDYTALRDDFPVQPPPETHEGPPIRVIVRSQGATAEALRRTLTSLIDQSRQDWDAVVFAPPELADHPIASLAEAEPRIRVISPSARTALGRGASAIMAVDAGAVLDPQALSWLAHALARTGCAAVVADHDHYRPDWRAGPRRVDPVFLPMRDGRDPQAAFPVIVCAFKASPALASDLGRSEGNAVEATRRALAAVRTPVAHLVRPLVSLPLGSDTDPGPGVASSATGDAGIVVIIPTRDQPDMLQACIATLHQTASRPDRLAFHVLDNRSREAASRAALARLTGDGIAVVRADEPFNWSRLNNQGAGATDAPLLVFANDDVEALTSGWDDRLRFWLARPEIGAVGARLLYPDRTVQHAGVVLGIEGRPVHEGRHAATDDGGPMDRWHRSRPVAAVTGAFLACRRDTFETVGGFDERLSVAYNDIDFCLRIRAAGMGVRYAADIELIHHESKTRGVNDSADRIAFDDAELADLRARWGRAMEQDPGYNPQWGSSANRPFDGVRDPPLDEILAWLDASAVPDPWAVQRPLRPI